MYFNYISKFVEIKAMKKVLFLVDNRFLFFFLIKKTWAQMTEFQETEEAQYIYPTGLEIIKIIIHFCDTVLPYVCIVVCMYFKSLYK